jgi:hypothetical protein
MDIITERAVFAAKHHYFYAFGLYVRSVHEYHQILFRKPHIQGGEDAHLCLFS